MNSQVKPIKLFPDQDRSDTGPATHSESHYTYLQRTARPSFAQIRDALEKWFQRYPLAHQDELRARIQSKIDSQFDGAFFELYLHELLLRLDLMVKVHPEPPNEAVTRAPDFLCTDSRGRAFYLEATLARELSEKQEGEKARKNQFYDALERLDSPNFFVGVKFSGTPSTPPPARKLRSFLESKLASLHPDELAGVVEKKGFDALPHWPFEHDGWKVELFPIPKSPEARGRDGIRPLGMFMPTEVSRLADNEKIRRALSAKAGAYGDLHRPYVIAVNAQLLHVDSIDEMAALFGSEAYIFSRTRPDAEPALERQPDGFWVCRAGPTNRRVSAVLIARHILPWTVARTSVRLYPNPWAVNPIGDLLERLPHARVHQIKFEWIEEEHPRRILNLPEAWPGDDG